MADKAHIWAKNDKITAARLNSMARPLNQLLAAAGDSGTAGKDKSHGDSDTANWANAIDDAEPVTHRYANTVGYRHPTYGTADLYEHDGPIGMYATTPAIIDAKGDIHRDLSHFGCMPCFLYGNGCGANGETVYLHVLTDCRGLPIAGSCSTAKGTYMVGSASCNQWFGLNEGGGDFYYPIAKIGQDPKFTCQKLAMHYNPMIIPLKADDASYLPPYNSSERGIQGMKFADPVEQSIVPIRGFNNHGGVRILPAYDSDGVRRSNAVMASPEIYGRATKEEFEAQGETPSGSGEQIYQVDFPGTDADGNTTCCTWYFYQPYNSMYPFASGDGGTLAKWPIYRLEAKGKERRKIGELTLKGGHIPSEDWQLWYQGCGEIVLGCGCGGTGTNPAGTR